MTLISKHNTKLTQTAKTFALTSAALLPIATAAHAGYDVDNGHATGSYSSNARHHRMMSKHMMRKRMMSKRVMTSSSRAVTGTYVRTVVITSKTTMSTIADGTMVAVSGTLTKDADDKNFTIQDAWGNSYAVETSNTTNAEATNKLVKGQTVRVYGVWREGKLYATNVRDLGTGVALGTRVKYKSTTYMVGESITLAGTLVMDADDDEFQIRDRNGVTTMVRTRLIPDSYGANKLQKGDMVRVSGYWIAEADGKQPQIEVTSFLAQ